MPQLARPAALLGLVLALAVPAGAQTAADKPVADKPAASAPAAPGECPPTAAKAEPATAEGGSSDGTAPENSGSTGWTGGTGGSQIGTNPSGASHETKTWHAPTARGLDLKGRPEPAPAC